MGRAAWGVVCSSGKGQRGCPGWAPLGRFLQTELRKKESDPKEGEASPETARGRGSVRGPGALCRIPAKPQGVTNSPGDGSRGDLTRFAPVLARLLHEH